METRLYPLTFNPILKEKIWGGQKLNKLFNKGDNAKAPVGESWEIADLEEGQSIVNEGVLKGMTLSEVIERYPKALLGESVVERFGKKFPLLIKFIDAASDLSIQVHPTDETSPTGTGKTEMWYIMQADENAKLVVGFKNKLTKEAFRKKLDALKIEEVLDHHIVAPGDAFFINAGRIHAIGGGVLLAEIQQTSDVTYRVYDYNRKDKEGKLRDLHIEESIDVMDFNVTQDFKLDYPKVANEPQVVKHHSYFKTNYIKVAGKPFTIDRNDSFTILMVVSGEMDYICNGKRNTLKSGSTVLIPALCERVEVVSAQSEILEIHL